MIFHHNQTIYCNRTIRTNLERKIVHIKSRIIFLRKKQGLKNFYQSEIYDLEKLLVSLDDIMDKSRVNVYSIEYEI